MLRTLALALLATVTIPLTAPARGPLPDWPPADGGDDALKGCQTTPQSEWGGYHTEQWNDAMSIVGQVAPGVAASINAATGNGSVHIVSIQNPANPTPNNPSVAGKSDSNTIGVELVGRTPTEIAGTIIHEWKHVQGKAEDPDYDSGIEACHETAAYSAQIDALCAASCEPGVEPPTCSEFGRVSDRLEEFSARCAAEGGSSSSPSCSSACACT